MPTPLAAEWAQLCTRLSEYGNPSSIHWHGRQARRLLDDARYAVAKSLSAPSILVDPEQIIFTSSGSEANQLAIQSFLAESDSDSAFSISQAHWILAPTEHDSVMQVIEWLRAHGGSVDFLPVQPSGEIEISAVWNLIKPETKLVSLLVANNETGVLTLPPADFISQLKSRKVRLHLDAAQLWGKMEIPTQLYAADSISFSGHKIGAPGGMGVLWVNRGMPFPVAGGTVRGKQEKGRRGGTENLSGILGLGIAAQHVNPRKFEETVRPLRDRLESAIARAIPGTEIHGGTQPRIANTLNLGFAGVETDGMVMALDLEGFSVSSGSACSSGVTEPSPVLMAMGKSRKQAMSALRISLGAQHEWPELERFVEVLARLVLKLRAH